MLKAAPASRTSRTATNATLVDFTVISANCWISGPTD
jgi:hypothetical protein